MTIRSRKHTLAAQPLLNQSLLAMAAIGLPFSVQAQAQEKTMAEVKVEAAADVAYKADRASSPKLTAPLVDTPQTISVIRKELIQEQGASSIVEALRNTPGITLQLGENGNTSAGDTFQMRGFAAQGNVFVDGIRDLGAVTREAFNVEQIEVAKGPAGADIGRGGAGGYINLVSKLPTREDATGATLSFTQGGVKRLSADVSRAFGSSGAMRLNALVSDGSMKGSRALDRESKAIAPSVAWGLGTPTRVYLFSQHIRQDNVPDGGIPSVGVEGFWNDLKTTSNNAALLAAPRVDRNNWYGLNGDYEKVDADMITARIEHELAPKTTLTNTTRYGKSKMDRILSGINAISAKGTNYADWSIARTRQSVLQDNKILANTTNVVSEFTLGGLQHTLSTGLELLHEEQFTPTRAGLGTMANPANGSTAGPPANLYHPNPNDALVNFKPALNGVFTDGKTDTVAAYLFDTVKLNEQWQVNGGARFEHYSTTTSGAALVSNVLTPSHVEKSDTLASFKLGLLYKPAADGSIYLAFANSKTPPGSANFSLSSQTSNSINNSALDPQKTTNVELGTKWDVIQKQLALTAALYRTVNKNEFPQLVDAATNTYSQLGKREVQGIELGAVGQISRNWSVTAGIATMDTEIKEGLTGNATSAPGAASRWSPKVSATMWTTYKFDDKLTIGGGARYMGKQERLVDASKLASETNMPSIPHYTVVDAMASYKLNKNVALQLNLYNVFDKFYVNTLNNSGARATLGAPRYAQVTANFMF
ncbi:catecholate siderophore receptor Fiu [Duganella sp. Root336D2]|uniref:catecholate siderophore receptor Fiu n=1 Tax=Duganella sp. Root336D2 TaxID=1736518 RepID=UPI000A88E25A|nr:catecholate siderophore receptor Fiu [Duganella sp. Root336D2]